MTRLYDPKFMFFMAAIFLTACAAKSPTIAVEMLVPTVTSTNLSPTSIDTATPALTNAIAITDTPVLPTTVSPTEPFPEKPESMKIRIIP